MAQSGEERLDLVQVIVLGSGMSGKTALIKWYLREEFHDRTTLGIDFSTKTLTIDGKCVRARLWDTQGHWKAYGIIRPFIKRAAGTLIVVDSSTEWDSVVKPQCNADKTVSWQDATTLELVEQYIKDVRTAAGPSPAIVIAANKADQGACPHMRALQEYAAEKGIPYLETSAKDGRNVDLEFEVLISEAYHLNNKMQSCSAK